MHFLDKEEFADVDVFLEKLRALDPEATSKSTTMDSNALAQANKYLQRILDARMLRRRKNKVLAALPPKELLILPVPMVRAQERWVAVANAASVCDRWPDCSLKLVGLLLQVVPPSVAAQHP